MSIGTGIEAFINIVSGGSSIPKEFFMGYQGQSARLQDVLDNFTLSTADSDLPVLSIGLYSTALNSYIVRKYLVKLQPGIEYAPLGDYATEKDLILIDTIYPNEQTVEAAISAVNAEVYPHFDIASADNLLSYLNASVTPIDLSDNSKIYYFQFSTPSADYTFVLSEAATRGIYGAGHLQFATGDLLRFFTNATGTPVGGIPVEASATQIGGVKLAGDLAGTASLPTVPTKVNKAENPEYSDLDENPNVYAMAMFDYLGGVHRSTGVYHDVEKNITIFPGTQATWAATDSVTDGNMSILVLPNAYTAFSFRPKAGSNVLRIRTRVDDPFVAVDTVFLLANATGESRTQFFSVECPAAADTLIKAITVPANAIVTVDITGINIINTDKKIITGRVQFSFLNDGATTSVVYNAADDLRYKQYSTIKAVPGAVTNTDCRIDATIAGNVVSLKYINTPAGSKLTAVNCEVKYNINPMPV